MRILLPLRLARLTPPPCHYEQLGVSRQATPAQLKEAYYTLCKKLHPDAGEAGESAELQRVRSAQFVNVAEAYQVLRDPERRRRYDMELAASNVAARATETTENATCRAAAQPMWQVRPNTAPQHYVGPLRYNIDEHFYWHYGFRNSRMRHPMQQSHSLLFRAQSEHARLWAQRQQRQKESESMHKTIGLTLFVLGGIVLAVVVLI